MHRRIPRVFALAIFASEAISSTADATEEIRHVLADALPAVMEASGPGDQPNKV